MNFRRKGEQKYMKKRIVFELAAGLLLSDAIYASVKRKWLPSVLFFIFYSNGTVWPKIWLK